jgi:ketosteroid isomerase-like protein
MPTGSQLIKQFYAAFARRDYQGMIECYAPDILFEDPVFTLQGKQVGAMWHMLCERGEDLQVTLVRAHGHLASGDADWEARYTFSTSKRPVHNILHAHFQFQDGKIVRHRDEFDFWRWSRMALGPTGLVLGWSPMVKNKVRATAKSGLEKFIAAHPEYQ